MGGDALNALFTHGTEVVVKQALEFTIRQRRATGIGSARLQHLQVAIGHRILHGADKRFCANCRCSNRRGKIRR
jgi:hypothetical protein